MRIAIFHNALIGVSLVLMAAHWHAFAQIQPTQPYGATQPIQPLGQWRTQDGRTPDLSESTKCRGEARQLALQMSSRQSAYNRSDADASGDVDRR